MTEDKLDGAAKESLARIASTLGMPQAEVIEAVNREVARRQNVAEFSRLSLPENRKI